MPERVQRPRVNKKELDKAQEVALDQVGGYLSPILSDLLEMGNWAADIDWSKRLKREGWLKTPAITRAFKLVPRYDFLPVPTKGQCGFALAQGAISGAIRTPAD